jgi:signal transduction histidine kinase
LFNEDKLYVAAARGISQADSRVTLPGRSGVLGEVLNACEARLCEEPSRDAELQFIAALQPTRQALVIPLGVGLDIYGVLLFAHPKPAFFDRPDRIELMELAAQQAMIALQNARLYHDLEQEKERISEIQEEAQKKLARDLHDGPTQSIGAIGMRVNFARRLLERDPKAASDELYKIEELARRTTKEIRQMLFTLRPLVLESEGLIPALHHLADKMMENHGQKVVVEADDSAAADLEVGKQGVVFFIIEEAANNARKHARADHIWLRLKRDGDMMIVEVADDGRGFDVAAVEADYEKRGSMGMINLRERAELVNGILKIGSTPGRGSTVRVIVPLSVEAAERLHRAGFAA